MKYFRLFLFFLIALPPVVNASDYEKEKRWADQVVDGILDGEAVWLNNGSHKFLGILTPAKKDKHKGAIILHGIGVHPDWQQIVQPLRVGLTDHGWNTLSIQMPILYNEAEYNEYAPLFERGVIPRIEAAIKHLKKTGNTKITIVAHSMGTDMATYYLSKKDTPIVGLVAIGMSAEVIKDRRINPANTLPKIHNTPILDLYGSDDFKTVLATTKIKRDAAAKAGNTRYTQKKVTGANHFFADQDEELIKAVSDWLEKL